jgi:hypothetical protein
MVIFIEMPAKIPLDRYKTKFIEDFTIKSIIIRAIKDRK